MNRKRSGEIAESAFLYTTTRQGFTVSKPWGDSSRYDFIVEHRGRLSRVQVKSTSQALSTGAYHLNAQRRLKDGVVPYRPDEVDFFAAYIVPLDTWYIIPQAVVGTRACFFLHPNNSNHRFAPYREAWHLL